MARKVIWSEEAIIDLGAIVRYIALDNSPAAEALARTIFERTRMLADFPHAGRRVPEEHEARVREIIVEPYRADPGRIVAAIHTVPDPHHGMPIHLDLWFPTR